MLSFVMPIDTDRSSELYRVKTLDVDGRRILMSRLQGSAQEADLTNPVNCRGLGRIRHFRRVTSAGWPANSLPIDPAARALSLGDDLPVIEAQVFQNSACNWRCWYCFVPFNLLSADERYSEWISMNHLMSDYSKLDRRPPVVDLSGGQPELTPELVLWSMRSLKELGLDRETFLWSDDNLSTDYFWSKLTQQERDEIVAYKAYARVGCFKGFDRDSFCFNTMATADRYELQFDLMRRSIAEGLEMYAYTTFTSPNRTNLKAHMERFVDDLQAISPNLPLRTIPLEVQVFSPTQNRIRPEHLIALQVQQEAIMEWNNQLNRRFSPAEMEVSICDVAL
jgi:uncharacterized Fe-S cluster-containing radical SAM superfamily protein